MRSSLAGLKPIDDETRRGKIVHNLRNLIVQGQVAPGERLTETALADQLGVSRGPLREAIRELVESGLVVSIPYKGLFVRQVTRRDLEELYSLRTTLEKFAFQLCWDRRSEDARQDLIQRNTVLKDVIADNNDRDHAIRQELILHNWCYELANHNLLMKSWERMKPNLQFYFTLHQRAHNRAGPLREAHDAYVGYATGESLDDMLLHLDQHMRQGLETTIQDLPMD